MPYSDEALKLNLDQDPEQHVQEIITGPEVLLSPSPVEDASAEVASLFDAPELASPKPQKPDFAALANASPADVHRMYIKSYADRIPQIRAATLDGLDGNKHTRLPGDAQKQFLALGAHNHEV